MAIRLRMIEGQLVALCAARSVPEDGDIYLDDAAHGALSTKFALDFNSMFDTDLPFEASHVPLIDEAESNNPNRAWWDATYGESATE